MKHRAVGRRTVVMGIGATAGVAAVGGIALSAQASSDSASSASSASAADSLAFDPDGYTRLTTTVTDTDGTDHAVTYHFWKAITYVADPVDETYCPSTTSAHPGRLRHLSHPHLPPM